MAGYLFNEAKKGKAKTSIKKVAKVSKKVLKALEKARKARARKRKQELRKKREEFLKPFYSEITGRRYKTKAGMIRAEEKIAVPDYSLEDEGDDFMLVELAESITPVAWEDMSNLKYRWNHNSGILSELFYDYWEYLRSGKLREYYNLHGLDNGDSEGHTLRDFIGGFLNLWTF